MTAVDPDPHGAATLASAIAERFDPGAPRWWGKGTVTAVNGATASVNVPGDTLEMASTGWYLPRVGDVVFCVGPPGQWLILGPVGSGTAAIQTGPATVTGGQTADDLHVTHDAIIDNSVAVGFELRAQGGIRTEAGLSAGGDMVISGNALINGRPRSPTWSSSIQDGALRWAGPPNPGALEVVNYAGNEYRGVFASAFAPPPSWRRYKINQRPLVEVLGAHPGEVIDRLDVHWSWTYDPAVVSFADGAERIGPKLDEMPDALVILNADEAGEDRSSWDLAGMVTVLLAEVQSLRRRVAELEEAR